MDHAEGAGRPLISTTNENNEQAQQMIQADRRITVDKLVYSLQISHGSAYQISHDNLGLRKVSARWLVHSKMLYEVVDFRRIRLSMKWCMNGYKTIQKLSSQMEFTNLWTAGTSASKRMGTM